MGTPCGCAGWQAHRQKLYWCNPVGPARHAGVRLRVHQDCASFLSKVTNPHYRSAGCACRARVSTPRCGGGHRCAIATGCGPRAFLPPASVPSVASTWTCAPPQLWPTPPSHVQPLKLPQPSGQPSSWKTCLCHHGCRGVARAACEIAARRLLLLRQLGQVVAARAHHTVQCLPQRGGNVSPHSWQY